MDREAAMVLAAGQAHRLTQYMGDDELGLPGPIDEVSLLFATPKELDEFVVWASGEAGMDHFASVPADFVQCEGADWWDEEQGVEEGFNVRFEFLRLPGADWRIEAMCVLDGTAPLHEAWLEMYGSGCVVHASYKVPSATAYAAHVRQGVHAGWWAAQPTLRASYANSYGRFSYYQHPSFGVERSTWLLKPRVNLRDA